MVIDITYFDKFVDEDYLIKITKCKVISKTPCFSREIRLRKVRNTFVTFHTSDFYSSNTDYCYGVCYRLEIDNLEVYKLYHSFYMNLKEINISTIKVDSVEKFMRKDFEIVESNVKSLCFVAERNDKNAGHYRNRKTKVNFNKRLLLNFLKI